MVIGLLGPKLSNLETKTTKLSTILSRWPSESWRTQHQEFQTWQSPSGHCEIVGIDLGGDRSSIEELKEISLFKKA
jgi:hypothetical protein